MLRCPWSPIQPLYAPQEPQRGCSLGMGRQAASPCRCASSRCARTGRASQTPAARPRPWRRRRRVHHRAAAWLTRQAPRGASPAPAFQTCSGALSPHSAQLRSIWTCQRRGRPQHAGGPSGLRQRACALQCTTTNYRPCAPRARGPGRALVGHPRAAGQLLDVQLDRDHVRDAVPARLRPVRRRARVPVPQRARAQHAAPVECPARQLRRKRGVARTLRPARRAPQPLGARAARATRCRAAASMRARGAARMGLPGRGAAGRHGTTRAHHTTRPSHLLAHSATTERCPGAGSLALFQTAGRWPDSRSSSAQKRRSRLGAGLADS